MTTPSFVNAGARAAVAGASAITPVLPASLVNGNLLIGVANAVGSGLRTFTWPTGWDVLTFTANPNQNNVSVATRIVAGGETNPTINVTGGTTNIQAQIVQYTGNHASAPIGNWQKAQRNDNLTSTTWYLQPGLLTQQANSRVVMLMLTDSGITPPTPSGYTSRSNLSGGGGSLTWFDADMTAQGTAPDISGTLSGAVKWFDISIEITNGAGTPTVKRSFEGETISGTFTSTNTKTLNITTAQPNTIVVAVVYNERNIATQTVTTSVAGGGLTWNLWDSRQLTGVGSKGDLQVWWALAASPLSNAAITATLNQNTDGSCMALFAVAGADTTAPFDTAGPFYATNDGNSGNSTIQLTGVGITAARHIEFWLYASWTSSNVDGPSAAGFSTLAKPQNIGGTLPAYLTLVMRHGAAALSGQTRASQTTTSNQKWQLLDFAIREPTVLSFSAAFVDDLGFNLGALSVFPLVSLSAPFADDLGLNLGVLTIVGLISLSAAFADDAGFNVTAISVTVAFQALFVDENGFDIVAIDVTYRPMSQQMVTSIGI